MEQISGDTITIPFWKRKALEDMSPDEWESLCDGCGKCCLLKIEYEDTGEICYTNVACKLFDSATCRCVDYEEREEKIPDCAVITAQNIDELFWLPPSCAYRRLREGKDLEWWHPLVSKDESLIHRMGISVQDKVIPEQYVKRRHLERHIIDRVPGRNKG